MGLGYKVYNEIIEHTREEEDRLKQELAKFGIDPWEDNKDEAGLYVRPHPQLPELRMRLEIARLRAALEKYADKDDWSEIIESPINGVECYSFYPCMVEGGELEPWVLAQEALK